MDAQFLISVLMRWLHVAAAVAGVGATLVGRFVLVPALARLPNGAELFAGIRPLLSKFVHAALGVVILTGFYNYLLVAIPAVVAVREAGSEVLKPYHSVMGVKIILSVVLFVVAVQLLKPGETLPATRKQLLTVNVVVGLVILLLAAFLRRLWTLV